MTQLGFKPTIYHMKGAHSTSEPVSWLLSVNRNAIRLMGRVHTDLFTQPRIMIDGVNVHVKLTQSPAAFCLMIAADNI